MKSDRRITRILTLIVGISMAAAACAPIPVVPPGGQTPAVSVLLPNLAGPGVAVSPLQPTTATTGATVLTPSVALLPTEAPAPTVVGPVWEWVSSEFEDGTVLAPGDPSRYTFQLLPDGNALVQADCNFGTASYQATPSGVSFGPIGTTKIACPPDSLDSEFLGQLRNLDHYVFKDDGLLMYLLESAGAMQLRAAEAAPLIGVTPTPIPPVSTPAAVTTTINPVQPTPQPVSTASSSAPTQGAALAGTKWVLASLMVNGQALSPVEGTTVTLEVTVEGDRISGSTGCNQYRATLTADAAGATVAGAALLTRKTCAARILLQEVEYVDALLRTRAYIIGEDQLTLLAADDETLLVFVRR